jgi:hypothetical protein
MIRTIHRDDQSGYYNAIHLASMLAFTESIQLISDIGIYSIPASEINYRRLSRILGIAGVIAGFVSIISAASIATIAFVLRHW